MKTHVQEFIIHKKKHCEERKKRLKFYKVQHTRYIEIDRSYPYTIQNHLNHVQSSYLAYHRHTLSIHIMAPMPTIAKILSYALGMVAMMPM